MALLPNNPQPLFINRLRDRRQSQAQGYRKKPSIPLAESRNAVTPAGQTVSSAVVGVSREPEIERLTRALPRTDLNSHPTMRAATMVWILDWIVSGNAERLGIAGGLLKPRPSNSVAGFANRLEGRGGRSVPSMVEGLGIFGERQKPRFSFVLPLPYSGLPGYGIRIGLWALAIAALLMGTSAQADQRYFITDLGTLGGSSSSARGINKNGQVVGDSSLANGSSHAFLYSGGIMTDLGTLGGSNSIAYAINDSGQIVGQSDTPYGQSFGEHHSFLYSGGVMSDLGTLGGHRSTAYDINNSGQVVGDSYLTGNMSSRAFLYSGGVMMALGTFGGSASRAMSINDSGQIVGNAYLTGDVDNHAFLYSGSFMSDLGTLRGTTSHDISYANGINDSGQIVGFSKNSTINVNRAFLYNNGVMSNIGTLVGGVYSNSVASGINNTGQVVGSSQGAAVNQLAFLYTDGIMSDLNSLLVSNNAGWILFYASAINDVGQIIANGKNIQGYIHALLLTPITLEILDPLCIRPTTVSTTCTTGKFITQQNGSVSLTQDTETLMQANVQRTGAVADGVTRLLLRMRVDSPVTLTLKPEDGSTPTEQLTCPWGRLESLDGSTSSCNSLTVRPQDVPNIGKVVFAVFRAPDGVPQASGSLTQVRRNITVDVTGGSSILISKNITLQAPPVILIHGVWSSPDAWIKNIQGQSTGITGSLLSQGFDVYWVDHSAIEQSASSFDPYENAQVFGQVDSWVRAAKLLTRGFGNTGLAITQVDVVGHSMGGLIARARTVAKTGLSYSRPENAWQGDFHKIITIGTPHRGTPIADALVANNCNRLNVISDGSLCLVSPSLCLVQNTITLEGFFSMIGKPIGPAVLGFQTGSVPIQHIGLTNAPAHAIIGISPDNSNTESDLNQIMKLFQVNSSIDSLLGGNGNHDTIVPISSQKGGTLGSANSQTLGIVHADLGGDVGETQSADVFNRLRALLIAPAQSSVFAQFTGLGNGGSYRQSLKQCTTFASTQAVMAATASAPSFTMLPAPGTVVTPGQVVNLTFDVAGGVPATEGLFSVNGDLYRMTGSPPYSLTYTVPANRAGVIQVAAFAFGTQNYAAGTSLTVLPTQAPTQLKTTPESLTFTQQDEAISFKLMGIFSGSIEIDLSAAEAGTTYATQSGNSNVVSVSAAGIVTAKATGQDSIIVSNSGKTATVPVTVNITNHAPVIQIHGGTAVTMAPGEAKTLTVNATDQEGNAVALSLLDASAFSSFTDQGGGNGSLSLHPLPADVGVHTFHVYALDNGTPALGVTARIQVTVSAANQTPTANAGANLTVRQGSVVTLNGSASSDPDNGPAPLSFAWTKSAGAAVSLINANSATPKFSAGVIGQYTFALVVNDGQANSVPASVKVTVPKLGDIDLDGDVDNNDLTRITSTLNKPASSLNDLRDINGDMKLDALDTRKLVLLCTRPRCAVQ